MYNKFLTIRLLTGFTLLLQLFAMNVFAADETGQQSISLGLDLQDFGYKEFDDQDTLLAREDGWIPGISAAYSYRYENYLLDAAFTYHQGDVVYDGQTQGGAPYKTHTNEQIIDASLSLGFTNALNLSKPSMLFLGIGFREWQRDILPAGAVSGLFETYHWYYGFIGARVEFLKEGKLSLWLDGRLTRPIDPVMNVCFSNYDCVDLNLGVETGTRVLLPIHYRLYSNVSLIVEPYFESWDFGRSPEEALSINGVPTGGTIYEPRSETRNIGISITISSQF